ncbi:hypothetical protein KR018_004493 [Drosophila ironensis]|nr:hypothetical protein KR018_004493 [Drosophila ironensis]
MVLVSNEWLKSKDDEQQSNAESTTPAPEASEAVSLSTVSPSSHSTSPETSKKIITGIASNVKNKNLKQHATMDTSKKSEQDQLSQITEKEQYEIETSTDTNNVDSNENQQNNNMQFCDSNTNTLQGTNIHDRRTSPQLSSAVSQQVLNMAMNSVLNANAGISIANSIYSSLGVVTNSALQREQTSDCTTYMVSPATQPSGGDLNIGLDPPSLGTGDAKIVLQCEAKSHKFETRTITLQPNQECKVGRLIAKSKASEGNAIFDCKVLSRNHAILWYTPEGRFWVKDTKSSNGTFINDNKLGNDPAELHFGDIVKFGVEVIENSRQEVHGCIIARVTLYLPDGREAISFESDQLQLTGPKRISFDEIQRLNSFLQEAAQRERTLKAKLSSLQGVLDSTRKNSAMCWQSMITEDQLLHKINLLERKLQVMEKNVPENALRNEIVKLLEDKTTYQLTAKEALRKVYQERCDAMQMLSKMEMAYATSENECGILRAQIVTSKQTLQDFNSRLENLQEEYIEYQKESLRQQQEAKEQEDCRLEALKDQLAAQECEKVELQLQVTRLNQIIAVHDSEQKLQEQKVLEHLNAVIPDDDEYDDEEFNDGKEDRQTILAVSQDVDRSKIDVKQLGNEEQEPNNIVICQSNLMNLLNNSDLSKGEGGSEVLKAIYNDEDDVEGDLKVEKNRHDYSSEVKSATKEFIHSSPNVLQQNGTGESLKETKITEMLCVKHFHNQNSVPIADDNVYISPEFPTDQAIEMLQEECDAYKEKTNKLTHDIYCLQEQIDQLKEQLEDEIERNAHANPLAKKKSGLRQTSGQDEGLDNTEKTWVEDFASINNPQLEQEEELVVYKERLEESESNNMQLRNEISQLRLKQTSASHQVLLHRFLPLGCVAFAALIYFLSSRI